MGCHRHTYRRLVLATLVLFVALLAALPAAAAGVTLSTRFPGITVKPGEKVNLMLDVENTGPSGIVNIQVAELPQGWEAPSLRGGGFAVSQVFVPGGKSESVNLELKVPDQASEQAYRILLKATGSAGVDQLPVELKVAKTAASRARLTTQFPALKGASDAPYTFKVDLANDSDAKQTFALSAQAPKGWEVAFKPAYENKRLVTIPVDANGTQGLEVEVKVPAEAEAGTYKIPVSANAGSISANLEVQLDVEGRYELGVTTPSGRLSAEATVGRNNPLTIQVENKGSAPVRGVTLSASTPPNWSVTFNPDKINDELKPGDTRQVEATLKPDTRAIAGDYVVSVTARAEATSKRTDFRVGVRTSTTWGLVGVLVVVLVVGGVGWVFKTYGRR